jgi:formylglycine-generating enzyme required for sulfatase activity
MLKPTLPVFLIAFVTFLLFARTSHAEQYLFLVGVRDYSQTGELTDLKFAEDDVHTLAKLFSDMGVPGTNIVLMTQRVAAAKARFSPRSELIRKELDLILNLLRPEDSIIVGFSGHGLQFKGDNSNYYCPIDAIPDTDHKDTLVSLTEVYRKLEKCRANTKLLLVDACRNDPLSSTAKAARRIEIEPVFSRPASVFNGGTVAIFSCSESEQSFEHPDLKSGLFFYFVNRALAGEADTDNDNVIDLPELENFTIKNVQRWAQSALGKSQTPESRGTRRGAMQLARFDRKLVPKLPPIKLPSMDRKSLPNAMPNLGETRQTLTNSIGMKLALIPKGTFMMGSPESEDPLATSERPLHSVTISKDYYLGAYEVTQAQYERIMGKNPSRFKGVNNPVEKVSYVDAIAFCKKLSELPEEKSAGRVYRLPTEAEWEYTCRAGSTSRFGFGDSESQLGSYGWFNGNSNLTTHPVGEKLPNAWGLYDMHGNVWEWCSDWYGKYPTGAVTDPVGPTRATDHVIRGGGLGNSAGGCRSAFRFMSHASGRDSIYEVGFRVALSSSEALNARNPNREGNVKNEQSAKMPAQYPGQLGEKLPMITNSIGMKMKLLPAGKFTMGSTLSPNEVHQRYPGGTERYYEGETPHQVTLSKSFYMGVHEVTVGQFSKFVESEKYKTEAEADGKGGYGYDQSTNGFSENVKYTWRNPGFAQDDNHPVVNVSWNDAVAFCRWLSRVEGREYRLPTEAEWEYSCRAGSSREFTFGDDAEQLVGFGNFADASLKTNLPNATTVRNNDGSIFTTRVGSYRSNEFGLYDMHGNVLEWCSDWVGDYPTLSVVDPVGPATGQYRVFRGGSWDFMAVLCRSARRSWNSPGTRKPILGFRVALSSPGIPK